MKVADAIRERHSCRAFLRREIDLRTIERILTLASRAPSGANIQPWRVAVVTGQTKLAIERAIEAEFLAGKPDRPDYRYYPSKWTEPYKSRRLACGMQLYSALGIGREDTERRREQWIQNYRSFGAPLVLYFFLESHLKAGAYLDAGLFIQSLILAAVEEGLATCLQESLAEYPDIVKQSLGVW